MKSTKKRTTHIHRAKPSTNTIPISFNFTNNPIPSSARTLSNSKPKAPLKQSTTDTNGNISCPAWSMSSLLAVLPESPSPICSSASSPLSIKTSSPLSQSPTTDYSSSRNQSFYTMSSGSKVSTSSSEIDQWIERTTNLCSLADPKLHTNHLIGSKTNMSTMYESSVIEIKGMTLTSVMEEESVNEMESHEACIHSSNRGSDAESPDDGLRKLMSRPKPYHAFLDEVKKQKLEDDIDSWKKAQHMKLVNKLIKKEASIKDWEFEETSKAMEEMKKQEIKLEKKLAKVLEKTHKRISSAKREANKKTAKVRRSTIEKISIVSQVSARIQKTRSLLWFKLMNIC